ncbi:MAG: C10 family peptidase [Muribaculaceae bacterium]|nr:C10 family peptidase [Muribaculaceae bacterium]
MRRILMCVALLFAAVQLSASPVDLVSAKAKAQQFVQQQMYGGKLRAPISGEMKLAHVEMNSKMMDRAAFYIFNSQNGYVVVSGDDRAEEILGYGDYPLDYNNIPCNMKALLGMLKEQIEYLQANENLQACAPSLNAPARIASVAPLLTALWDQEAPYWNQCVINGTQCLTGCPATSAAMVFHFWKYPDYMTPEVPAYKCNLSTGYWSSSYVNVAALPPVTFDWEHMRDSYSGSYSTVEANAVATLMRYVGQAEHMEYGNTAAGGSGVSVDSVSLIADAFKFFGYDEETVRVVKKTSAYSGGQTLYTDAEWAAIMQEELSEGRPIVFCAVAGGFFGGGHAFNVDGYDANTNKYHINFGWSGSSNNYYAINSFTGSGSTFNQYQQMVIGIQPPIKMPRLKADAYELSMECFKNHTNSAHFNVTGRNLEGNVTLRLIDENDVFSIDKTEVIPDEDNRVSETINVTYAPKTEGNYTATVIVSTSGVEDFEIVLHGSSDYELYRPVMAFIDESSVTATSFRADWTDATPVENVTSYTLEVMTKPNVILLTEADWSNVPAESTNHAADAANYLPDGWTFEGSKLYLDGGFLSPSKESVLTANCDITGYSVVSVIIRAKSYSKGANTKLTVATDMDSKELTLAKEVETYLVVLEVGNMNYVKFICGNYPEIQSIKIYGGEITDLDPFVIRNANETGDATYRLIEGITPDTFYTVNDLTPGGTFLYRVKALYVNGVESTWSNIREVVLQSAQVMKGDVDGDGKVNIDDVTMLIDNLLTDSVSVGAADCDDNGVVNIDDLTYLIDYLLRGEW